MKRIGLQLISNTGSAFKQPHVQTKRRVSMAGPCVVWLFCSEAPHRTGVSETRAAVSPLKAICRAGLCLHTAIPLKLSPFQMKFP